MRDGLVSWLWAFWIYCIILYHALHLSRVFVLHIMRSMTSYPLSFSFDLEILKKGVMPRDLRATLSVQGPKPHPAYRPSFNFKLSISFQSPIPPDFYIKVKLRPSSVLHTYSSPLTPSKMATSKLNTKSPTVKRIRKHPSSHGNEAI